MTDEHTILGLLGAAARRLARLESGRRDAEVLLAHALGWTRARLAAHGEIEPPAAERERFASLVERRARGEPVAYLIGRREFWSLPLAVGPAVLVPRPETELLVERALELCEREQARIADLGTGSGAIALALAHERAGWDVTAVDRSPAALAVARANAAALGLGHIRFVEGDWFAPLAGERFDLIAANPPYVAADDPVLEGDSLRFEPRAALTPGGGDALADLRTIIRGAPAHLAPGGWLLLEHGATQADAVAAELVACGFAHVRSHPDLAGHPRMTEGRLAFQPRNPGRLGSDIQAPISRNTSGMAMIRFETSHGDFTIELFEKEAPISAANFLAYVDEGFFDGTIFHRVIPGFVIQGGGLTPDYRQKPNHPPIENEATNGLKNLRGTLSMARTNEVNSATSQFFVNLVDNAFLDHAGPRQYGYAVFGKVVEGMDTVDRIAAVERGRRGMYDDAPKEDIVVKSARRVDAA